MGKIPATTNMISAIITNPQPGQAMTADQTFNISVQLSGLSAGSFTNAASTYYSAPQDLDAAGQVIGHTHVTVQDLGDSLTPSSPPDATKFAFFKGINDAGNGQGLLQAVVTGGLPAGNYRVCTMTSSSNHQPVLMPVAQRGAQDDCQKFTVAASGTTSTSGSGSSASSGTSSSSSSSAAEATSSTAASSTSSAAPAASTSAAASTSSSGSLGGAAPAITNSGDSTRPFEVNGNTFVNQAAAVQRSCDIQFNACADAFNSGKLSGSTLADCSAQETTCLAQ